MNSPCRVVRQAGRNAGRWCGRDQVTIDVHSKKRPKRGDETSRLLTRCANSTPPRPLVMTSKRGYEAVRRLKVTYSDSAYVSQLAWERLEIPREDLGEVAREMEV